MKGYPIALAASLVLAGAAACSNSPTIPTIPTLTVEHVSRQEPAADAPVAEVAAAMTGLGYRLDTTAFPAGHNSVISPLSIAYAFAMARAGAGGDTAAQLDQVLGFPSTGLPDAFNAITRRLVTADVPPTKPRRRKNGAPEPAAVCVGNGLFLQHGQPVGEPFLRTLAAQYGAGVHPVDFAGGKATDVINRWASQQTAGRIKKVFDALSPDTKLVLANTVYLRADWARSVSFSTGTGSFSPPVGDPQKVPTITAQSDLRYAAGTGWQAVEVPYAGTSLAMRILVPARGEAPGPLLAPKTMSAVTAALHSEYIDLTVPRWDFASDLDLVPALEALGLTVPFSPGADFGGISPDLYVGAAIHRANITVDEWGTEAAAVTGLAFPNSARVPPATQLTVDRPFAFAIVDTATGVPLFMGQVADPSAH